MIMGTVTKPGHSDGARLTGHGTPRTVKGEKDMSLWSIFITVFLAELGDKTQLATLLFAADSQVSRVGVFCASAGALVLSSLLAVLVGSQLSAFVSPKVLKVIAGIGFIVIGGWMLIDVRS
jgi:putative Ca2+/H+ antiporter (TMEM165/GDT1 family)